MSLRTYLHPFTVIACLALFSATAHAQASRKVLFVTLNGSYNTDGANLFSVLSAQAGSGNATYVTLSGSGGQVVAALQNATFDQIWIYDLSTGPDNYATDYSAIASWYASHPSRHLICDGRILSSIWSGRYTTEGSMLATNYHHNLALRFGGLVIATDHDAFANQGANTIAAAIGIGPFTGNFAGSFPLDSASPLATTPNVLTSLSNDTTTSQVPYGLQANGLILHAVGYHSGNTSSPGLSTTIDSSLPSAPTATGAAAPPSLLAGASTTLTAQVTPGTAPGSTGLSVTCDLSALGGSVTVTLTDDGQGGDTTAADLTFSRTHAVGPGATAGAYLLPCNVADAQGRGSTFNIALTIEPTCGDGRLEGAEACDDGGVTSGDGCSATCAVEAGYACAGAPSTCVDQDECTLGTDDCASTATCLNAPGSFTCVCPQGYAGDGTVGGSGCTEIDECASGTHDCSAAASCTNLAGSFECTCSSGYEGDGHTSGSGCVDVDECAAGTDTCATDAICTNLPGSFSCMCSPGFTGDGQTCTVTCGDGMVVGNEGCDDGNVTPGDGCGSQCTAEEGWVCTGAPSACAPTCGDGLKQSGESCDDGNATSNDGCSASCAIENGWLCDDGAPTTCATDGDSDGIAGAVDNCPEIANADQTDTDQDGTGDACEAPAPEASDADQEVGCGCGPGGDSAWTLALLTLALAWRAPRRRHWHET